MAKSTTKGEIIKKYLTKFKSASNAVLARKIYKENTTSFKDVESVRTMIRYYNGNLGEGGRKRLADKTHVTPAKVSNPYSLPESYKNDYTPFEIKQSRILIISDLHFPYQDNKAIELALDYGKSKNTDCIIINGDLIDFANISRHERDFRARSIKEEFDATRTFLKSLRLNFPKARIIWKHGNHCERWEKWLYVKAPEVFDVSEFRLDVILQLGELKVETVKDKRLIKVGKLTLAHGHELPGGSGGVNPARSTFLKTLDSILVGHFHRTSNHVETTLTGEVISVSSSGCLCCLNPLYLPINKHNLGFAYCDLNIKTGEYQLENLKIIKGKVY